MNPVSQLIVKTLPFLPKKFVYLVSVRKYIAGPTLNDATRVIHSLNDKGMMTTIDVLGRIYYNKSRSAGRI